MLDPGKDCSAGTQPISRLRRSFSAYSIFKDTAMAMGGNLPNFEFVYELGEPPWESINATLNHKPMPGFGAIRCWSKGFMSSPTYGSHGHWDIRDIGCKIALILNRRSVPFNQRLSAAVFRGGNRSCSFPPEHNDMQNWRIHDFRSFYRGAPCGRHKVQVISQLCPDMVDFADTENGWPRLSMEKQADLNLKLFKV